MDVKTYTSIPHGYEVEITHLDEGDIADERAFEVLWEAVSLAEGCDPAVLVPSDEPWHVQGEMEDWFGIHGAYPAPEGIDTTPPGDALLGILGEVDVRFVGDSQLVDTMAAWDRLAAYAQAQRARAISEMVSRDAVSWGPDGLRASVLGVSAELRLSRSAAEAEVAAAVAVCTRLPQVLELWEGGLIDISRARVFAFETEDVPDELAREMVAKVADQVPGWTAGQLRARLRKLCIELDPQGEAERLAETVKRRSVEVWSGVGGSANLGLFGLSPEDATSITERLDALARALPGDGRSIDQRRVDVAVDLLLGTTRLPFAPGRGMVDLTVGLGTLMGLAEDPAELGGWGPVVAEIARAVADMQRDGRWQATVIDDNGDPFTVALRRRPTALQARQVRARAVRCIFPGCRRPARRCDIDHRRRHSDGGPTLESNLDPLCRYHHRAKDELGWSYQPLGDGDYRWTSPTGHRYTTNVRDP